MTAATQGTYHFSLPWQELAQLRVEGAQPLDVAISLTPLLWVAAFTVVVVYPDPWHTEQARERCSRCSPEAGGTPWQLVQDSVAVADQVPEPWQAFAHVWFVAFQPTVAITSFTPLRWVAPAVVAL